MNTNSAACNLSLSVDHIVEKIFYNFELTDVRNCRFVCRRWALFGAKELQKRVTINFRKEPSSMEWFQMNENILSDQIQCKSKTLENLTHLMNNSNSISLSDFPCNSFSFYVGHLTDVGLQSFLSTHGNSIEKLEFCPLNVKEETDSISSTECVIANGLKKLLLEQTPNLKRLELHIQSSEHGTDETAIPTKSPQSNLDGSVQEDDNNAKKVLSKPVPVSVPVNMKLRVLNVWNHLPQDLFARLIEILPNLEEMTLENKDLHYLMRPLPLHQNFNTNIHLLKNFSFEPDESNLDLLELIANNSQDIQLREITFHFSFVLYSEPGIWLRVFRVVNTILESTADSLKIITWKRSMFLPGINFPVMKGVRKIRLIHYSVPQQKHQSSADLAQDQNQQEFDSYYFPKELCLGKSFPNLEIVRIRVINRYRYHLLLPLVSKKLLKKSSITRLFNNNTVPASSVQYIYIESKSQEVSERYQKVYLSQISKVFPNARVVCC